MKRITIEQIGMGCLRFIKVKKTSYGTGISLDTKGYSKYISRYLKHKKSRVRKKEPCRYDTHIDLGIAAGDKLDLWGRCYGIERKKLPAFGGLQPDNEYRARILGYLQGLRASQEKK